MPKTTTERRVRKFTKKHKALAVRIEKALAACHKAGLMGGVYDGMFCLWPEKGPHPADYDRDFFKKVDELGMIVHTRMVIDGGAGV